MTSENVAEEYSFPLSFAQQRLWFLDQISPGNPFYNISIAIPLNTVVISDILEKTINAIIERHETLRTSFTSVNGEPYQIVHSKREMRLQLIQCTPGQENRESIITRQYLKVISRAFDLEKDILVRATLLRFGEQDHFLIIVMHHIISDGWSLRIFWEEVVKTYNALAAGIVPTLDEIIIQYGDFVLWQREWLSEKVLANQLKYWQEQLSGLQTLNLNTDRPRPPVLTYNGAFHPVKLPISLSSALRTISNENGVTLYMTLLSAFAILLYRYSNQNSICIGSPVAGRNRVELERLIGFFINTLVMKIDLHPSMHFTDLLQHTKETTIGAFAHQDLPFEKLVEELHLERDLSRNPLFQVTFQLLNNPGGKKHTLSAYQTDELKLERGAAIFDLALNLVDNSEEIEGHFEYSTDLFNPDTIIRLGANFKALLVEIASNPKRRISEYSALANSELQKLIYQWNNASVDISNTQCIHECIQYQATINPKSIALFSDEIQYSFGDLNDKANQLAHLLLREGIKTETLAGVCMDRCPEMIIIWLAILKAGGAYVPMDPGNPEERIKWMISHTEMRVLIAHKKYENKLSDVNCKILFVEDVLKEIINEPANNLNIKIDIANRAYLIFTSGSTGMPKGVEITHHGLINLIAWHIREYNINSSVKATQLANPAFDASAWEVWPYLSSGAGVYIVGDETRLFPSRLLEKLFLHDIDICFIPTPLVKLLLAEPSISESKIKAILTGGDWLKEYSSRSLPFRVVNHYGPTENTVVATFCEATASEGNPVFPPIGKPITNVTAYILNDHFQPAPIGVKGDLYIGGESLGRCYFKSPAATASAFIPNPFSEKGGERLYKTGDKASFLPDGKIEFHGRTDEQVKIRGFRIELKEIELKLLNNPSISNAIVLVNEDDHAGKHLVAFLICKDEEKANPEIIREYLALQLPLYMLPDRFIFLEHFPLTPNGKLDKSALLKRDLSSIPAEKSLVSPVTPLEIVLEAIWSEVLNSDRIGIEQNFFTELGGHSLLATQLIARLRNTFDVEIPLQRIFEFPTISEFAKSMLHDPGQKEKIDKAAKILISLNNLSDDELQENLQTIITGSDNK